MAAMMVVGREGTKALATEDGAVEVAVGLVDTRARTMAVVEWLVARLAVMATPTGAARLLRHLPWEVSAHHSPQCTRAKESCILGMRLPSGRYDETRTPCHSRLQHRTLVRHQLRVDAWRRCSPP